MTRDEIHARLNVLYQQLEPLIRERDELNLELARQMAPYQVGDILERTVERGYQPNVKTVKERWFVMKIDVGNHGRLTAHLRQLRRDGTKALRTDVLSTLTKWTKIGRMETNDGTK